MTKEKRKEKRKEREKKEKEEEPRRKEIVRERRERCFAKKGDFKEERESDKTTEMERKMCSFC